jgi:urea transporter
MHLNNRLSGLSKAIDPVLLSYSQIFFSSQKWLGALLLTITFLQPQTGLFGLAAAALSIWLGRWWGLNRSTIQTGYYSYNAMLVGLGIGSLYHYTHLLWFILVVMVALTLLTTAALSTWWGVKQIPVFSVPFVLSIWVLMLTKSQFGVLAPASIQEEYILPGFHWLSKQLDLALANVAQGEWIKVFLKSLSAIFFIFDPLIGLMLFVGLFVASRINAMLAVMGFSVAAVFTYVSGASFEMMATGFLGFNFIMYAIAFGGFYVYPTARSLLNTCLLLMLVTLLSFAFNYFTNYYFQLPALSMPFSLAGIATVLTFQSRIGPSEIQLIPYPGATPETQMYGRENARVRFANKRSTAIYLPVIGEWRVSQAHNGKHTHKDHWQYAFDFDLTNENGFTYYSPGAVASDYLCYGMPVIAPAAGYVCEVHNYVPDNEIKTVNINNNWGNTVIIKHEEGLFSKLSHLQYQSIKVNVGDYVFAGSVIGNCGNSGRSPEPHLHFQMQSIPVVGAYTLKYPIANFLKRHPDGRITFHQNEFPNEGDLVKNVLPSDLLCKTFALAPYQQLTFDIQRDGLSLKKKAVFVVGINAWNKSYLYEAVSNSYLFYQNDGITFECYDFIGKKNSLLFDFYLCFQKILMTNAPHIPVHEQIMPTLVMNPLLLSVQDMLLPFVMFCKGRYTSILTKLNKPHAPSEATILTTVERTIGRFRTLMQKSEICIIDQSISTIYITKKNRVYAWNRTLASADWANS